MNTTLIAKPVLGDATSTLIARNLHLERYAFIPGDAMASWLDVGPIAWRKFADHWDDLTLDRYMADGGAYRFRRYGEFELQRPAPLRQLPHGPYEQSLYINPLNGGIPRLFDPLQPGFVQDSVLNRLLNAMSSALDTAEGRKQRWNIRLHPYRIRADIDGMGHPTPEGLHRDGVDYVASFLIQRHNIEGGETQVTDDAGKLLWRHTLSMPMELLITDDERSMHAVTPITPLIPRHAAYRDVLVIAFTKIRS